MSRVDEIVDVMLKASTAAVASIMINNCRQSSEATLDLTVSSAATLSRAFTASCTYCTPIENE